MKRDMDLIRELLFWLENDQSVQDFIREHGERFGDKTIRGHVRLLVEAGFAEVGDTASGEMLFHVERITWAGHEMLDAVRNAKTWAKAKKFLKDQAVSIPVSLWQQVLVKLLREQLGL